MDWQITLYHDEPEEASADSRTLSIVPAELERAISVARKWLDGYWQHASIHAGTYTPPVPGVRPAHFEDDDTQTPWLVGRDYLEQ